MLWDRNLLKIKDTLNHFKLFLAAPSGSNKVVPLEENIYIWSNYSDLTRPGPPNGGLVREMGPLISGKSRLVNYHDLSRYICVYIYMVKKKKNLPKNSSS